MLTLHVSAAAPYPAAIGRAAGVLRAGGIVAYPTDTFYGLAVDPRNAAAVARLYDVKGRKSDAAIPLVAASVEQAQRAGIFDARIAALAAAFWPGPLTIVMPARASIARRLVGAGATIAIRVPAQAVAQAVAEQLGFAITSTSANRSGAPPAATAGEVVSAFGDADEVDLLLDAGPSAGGLPSTIVEIADDGPRLIRAGAVAWERVLESLE
jgi:L-threonylcarbamoyladenylate synthase